MNRYGCYNRQPFKDSTVVQDGWFLDGVTRTPRMVKVKDAMSKDCQYSNSTPDERCTGCKWRVGNATD